MRTFVIAIIFFTLGYFVRDYLLQNPNILSPKNTKSESQISQNSVATGNTYQIIYNGNGFEPDSLSIKKGNYIAIRNDSDENLMWLTSDYKAFNTVRGYGKSEQVKDRMETLGNFTVTNKLKPEARVVIEIK